MMEPQLYDTLEDQVALVTGANRGIGEQIATELATLGATVFAGARDPSNVTAKRQHPVRLDLTETPSLEAAVSRIREEAGRLDVLVNNAGVIGPEGPLHELELGAVDAVLDTNLRGTLAMTRAALPLILEREAARIITVSSGAGSFGEGMMPSHLPYCISKAGINALTFLLHERYSGRGLLVNSVCPGWVRTDMGGRSADRSVEQGAETPVWLARFKPGSPSGRFWRDKAPIEW